MAFVVSTKLFGRASGQLFRSSEWPHRIGIRYNRRAVGPVACGMSTFFSCYFLVKSEWFFLNENFLSTTFSTQVKVEISVAAIFFIKGLRQAGSSVARYQRKSDQRNTKTIAHPSRPLSTTGKCGLSLGLC